jgi:hypothetical protein
LALLDHADVRLGFEEEKGKLVLAGIKRGIGAVGPWHFVTEEDAHGQACRFLFESKDSSIRTRYFEWFPQLPDTFTWTEGRRALGAAESTMSRFLKASKAAGMLTQEPDGVYRKVEVRK